MILLSLPPRTSQYGYNFGHPEQLEILLVSCPEACPDFYAVTDIPAMVNMKSCAMDNINILPCVADIILESLLQGEHWTCPLFLRFILVFTNPSLAYFMGLQHTQGKSMPCETEMCMAAGCHRPSSSWLSLISAARSSTFGWGNSTMKYRIHSVSFMLLQGQRSTVGQNFRGTSVAATLWEHNTRRLSKQSTHELPLSFLNLTASSAAALGIIQFSDFGITLVTLAFLSWFSHSPADFYLLLTGPVTFSVQKILFPV